MGRSLGQQGVVEDVLHVVQVLDDIQQLLHAHRVFAGEFDVVLGAPGHLGDLGLEARGFVRLVPDPADARTTRIEVTDRVREFDEPRMLDRTRGMLDDAFVGLTADETGDLLALLRRWLAGLTTTTQGEDQRS